MPSEDEEYGGSAGGEEGGDGGAAAMIGGIWEGIFGSAEQSQNFQQSQYDFKAADYFRKGALTPKQNQDLLIFVGLVILLVFLVVLFKFI